MTNEQIAELKRIVDGAPNGATHVEIIEDEASEYWLLDSETNLWHCHKDPSDPNRAWRIGIPELTVESIHSIENLRTIIAQHEEIERLRESVSALESKRPHWAQGYSSDSVAAQVSHDALTQLWQLLGADNQTEALAAVEKEWLDIEQFKPDNRKKCLVVVNGYGVHIDKYYEGKGFREYDGYITHWMPLQQPPKGESDEC